MSTFAQYSPAQRMNILREWLLQGWAMTIYVPIRRNFGRQHGGIAAVVGAAWLLAWSVLAEAESLMLLLIVYVFALVCHRIKDFARRRRGDFIHTYYGGESFLVNRLFRIKDEAKAKLIVEPLMVFTLGWCIYHVNPSVGWYFMGGAAAMFVVQWWINRHLRDQLDDMRNGMFENAELMGQFHRQNGRRF